MQKSNIAKFLLVILNISLVIGIVCLCFIPTLYDNFSNVGVDIFSNHNIIYQIAFYTCYIICLIIVYILINILKDVHNDSPFKKNMEFNLKKIAVMFMSLVVIIGIKVIFIPTILSFAVILVSFIASLSFYVLSQVFKMAIEFKHEIDFTV